MRSARFQWFGTTSCAAALALGLVTPVAGQRPLPHDSIPNLDAVVVTADRTTTRLASSIAAVSVLTAPELARVPHVTLADALRQVPGFALVNFDGLGHDAQVMVRGFYGGGEAEYVVTMIDGKPLNDVQAGLVAWDAIPLAAIERVEIVRGGASALWGDAAVGGVINVITRHPGAGSAQWSMTGGSHGSWHGGVDAQARILGRDLAVFGGFDRTGGFREHAERTTGRAGGTLTLASAPAGSVHLSVLTHWRAFDQPGPLLGGEIDGDRTASDVFYRFDRTDDRNYRLGLDGSRALGTRARLSGSVFGERRVTDAVRTIALSPDFADTKQRRLGTSRGLATAQLAVDETGLPFADRLILGVDASYGTLDSKYYAMSTGDRDAYRSATGEPGDLDAAGSGDRGAAAAYVQYTVLPVDAVRISVGARADWLRDTFEATAPDAGETPQATHAAFSPRVGVNVEYMRAAENTGHVYLAAGRSFKAPTIDQLFDQRRLPVPFPPFAVTTSNELLDPQHGTSLEAGIYHGAALVPGTLTGAVSVSVYQMDMEDELDFDLQTLRYVNIGRSRHRGIEAGLELKGPRGSTAFLNYTQQSATSQVGENAGRYLKAIPRHYLSGGLSTPLVGRLETGFVVSHAREIFLDDANTMKLPAYTRADVRVSHPIGGMRLFLDVRNLLDAQYSTTGFPDPSGSGAVYYHPAAGRTFDLGLRSGF
jgi:iron complex outermembrane receptor protein